MGGQALLLRGRQRLALVDDHRQVVETVCRLQLVEEGERPRPRQLGVEHDAGELVRLERRDRRPRRADRRHLHFPERGEQVANRAVAVTRPLDEQDLRGSLRRGRGDALEQRRQLLERGRLLERRDDAGVVGPGVAEHPGDHVDRDVARGRMHLQPGQQLRPVHHRQAHVEQDRVRTARVREREARVAALRDDPLEARVVCRTEQELGEHRIVLDDQQHPVVRRQRVAIVVELPLEQQAGTRLLRELARRRRTRHVGVAVAVRAGELDRERQRERAADVDDRLDMDLAAEQLGDLRADRQPQARAAEAPARRPVRLLEGLEDQPEPVAGDADAGVPHRERE